ncbi:MAG: AMP-binding protein [Desulfobacterales bacterium]|nr:MAG: AMP-binding protein [Desulfobacterales bacterium]
MTYIQKTIGQMLDDVTRQHAHRDALIHTEIGIRYDYQSLSREIDRVARGFISRGIKKDDKVAIWAPNVAEWLLSLLGLAKIGAVTVPIDPAASRENLQYILHQSECRGLIVAGRDKDEETLNMAREAGKDVPTLAQLFVIGDSSPAGMISWRDLIDGGKEVPQDRLVAAAAAVKPQDPVAIMYTSGTTGQPKGVVLDHPGLINKSMVGTERQGISATDRLCLFFPLFHMFGNTCIALAGILRGAALVMPCRIFNPAMILPAIPGEKCTAIFGSPSMLIALIDHPQFRKDDWASLSKGIIGGAPCPMELMRRIVEDIGVSDITVAYGITETSSWITMTHPHDPIELRVSTIGTALSCNEVKIVDPSTGETLGPGWQGELCTRGFLMKEYYKMPAATAAAIDRDNWFHTGDLGVMDQQGYIKITGRLKDVIVRRGIEIYPVEVEEAIYMLPEVSEVQVFGFDSPAADKSREVAAWIKLKEGTQLSLEAVAAHLRTHLPEEKMPRYYKFVSAFPMTGSGKVQKFKMAEMASKEYKKENIE